MKFHIVGNGESIQDILDGYDITIDELKNENKHIRSWNYLIPGTKLKIPVLTEALVEELNEIEPFIEDYYPKIKLEEEQYTLIDEENIIEVNDEVTDNKQINDIDETNEIKEIQEDDIQSKMETVTNSNENNNRQNQQVFIRYVYPQQYYNGYRPIVYVIPRR